DGAGRMMGLEGPGAARESFMHVEIDRLSDVGAIESLERGLAQVLSDVRSAVRDWREMVAKVDVAIRELRPVAPHLEHGEVGEAVAFLTLIADNNFTFLGYVEHDLVPGDDGPQLRRVSGSGLGILRGQDLGISQSFAELPLEVRELARDRKSA